MYGVFLDGLLLLFIPLKFWYLFLIVFIVGEASLIRGKVLFAILRIRSVPFKKEEKLKFIISPIKLYDLFQENV